MLQRRHVGQTALDQVFELVRSGVVDRMGKHGRLSFISEHEIYGVLAEEMGELLEAVRANNAMNVVEELLDIAVGAIFGVASLSENERYRGRQE